MWWRAPKASAILLNGSIVYLYDSFVKLTQSHEKAAEEWLLMSQRAGRALVNEMFNLIVMMASKSIEDVTFIIDFAWYIFLNQKPISIKYIPPDEEGVAKIIWNWDNCIICTDAQHILDPEIVKIHHLGWLVSGVFGTAIQMIQDYVGNSYRIEVEDTKSQARGDPYCEAPAYFYPI